MLEYLLLKIRAVETIENLTGERYRRPGDESPVSLSLRKLGDVLYNVGLMPTHRVVSSNTLKTTQQSGVRVMKNLWIASASIIVIAMTFGGGTSALAGGFAKGEIFNGWAKAAPHRENDAVISTDAHYPPPASEKGVKERQSASGFFAQNKEKYSPGFLNLWMNPLVTQMESLKKSIKKVGATSVSVQNQMRQLNTTIKFVNQMAPRMPKMRHLVQSDRVWLRAVKLQLLYQMIQLQQLQMKLQQQYTTLLLRTMK